MRKNRTKTNFGLTYHVLSTAKQIAKKSGNTTWLQEMGLQPELAGMLNELNEQDMQKLDQQNLTLFSLTFNFTHFQAVKRQLCRRQRRRS